MRGGCGLLVLTLVVGFQGCTSSADSTAVRLLHQLHEERQRILLTPNESGPVALHPWPALAVLVGTAQAEFLTALGPPDPCGPGSGDGCAGRSEWAYTFSHVPPHYMGGGLRLRLRFSEELRCTEAQWVPER